MCHIFTGIELALVQLKNPLTVKLIASVNSKAVTCPYTLTGNPRQQKFYASMECANNSPDYDISLSCVTPSTIFVSSASARMKEPGWNCKLEPSKCKCWNGFIDFAKTSCNAKISPCNFTISTSEHGVHCTAPSSENCVIEGTWKDRIGVKYYCVPIV